MFSVDKKLNVKKIKNKKIYKLFINNMSSNKYQKKSKNSIKKNPNIVVIINKTTNVQDWIWTNDLEVFSLTLFHWATWT